MRERAPRWKRSLWLAGLLLFVAGGPLGCGSSLKSVYMANTEGQPFFGMEIGMGAQEAIVRLTSAGFSSVKADPPGSTNRRINAQREEGDGPHHAIVQTTGEKVSSFSFIYKAGYFKPPCDKLVKMLGKPTRGVPNYAWLEDTFLVRCEPKKYSVTDWSLPLAAGTMTKDDVEALKAEITKGGTP